MYADQAPWKYLKSHQIDAVHWMRNLFAVGMSGILAFETGLGGDSLARFHSVGVAMVYVSRDST